MVSSQMNDNNIVNLEVLNSLSNEIEKNEFINLLNIFSSELNETKSNIEAALLDRNDDLLRYHAHFLKGLSSNFGAIKLTETADNLEKNVSNFTDQKKLQMVELIKQNIRITIDCISTEYLL